MAAVISAQLQLPKTKISSDPAQAEAVISWLRNAAIPLKSVEAERGFEDLQPLKAVLKDVRKWMRDYNQTVPGKRGCAFWVLILNAQNQWRSSYAILWAHSFHLSRVKRGFKPYERKTDFRPMGSYLAEVYGAAYYVLGVAFDHGAVQAGDKDADAAGKPFTELTEFTLGPASEPKGNPKLRPLHQVGLKHSGVLSCIFPLVKEMP